MYYEYKSPLTVQLELTSRCNHRCVHCYNYWRVENSDETTLTEDQLARVMKNLRDHEIIQMVITGGEPMIFPHLLIRGLELAKAFNIRCSINSNLTLVTPEITRAIKKNNSGVLTSMLSFDPEKHDRLTGVRGSHKRLVKGINLLREAKVRVSVNMVVMRQNLGEVYETGKFVKNLGVKNFTSTKVAPSLGDDVFEKLRISKEDNIKLFDQLLRLERELGVVVDTLTAYPSCLSSDWNQYHQFLLGRSCSAGKTFCAIGSNGQLRACVQHDKEYGSVIDEPISKIWPMLKSWRDGSYLPSECKECQYLPVCGAGCRATCQFFGDIASMDPDAGECDFKPIFDKINKIEIIDIGLELKINSTLQFRKEDFGTVLIVNGTKTSVVTNDTAYLLKELHKKDSFTLRGVFKDFGLEIESAHKFLSALYKKKIFLSVGAEENQVIQTC